MSLACGVGDNTKIIRILQNGEDGMQHATVKHTLEIVRYKQADTRGEQHRRGSRENGHPDPGEASK